MPQENQVLKCYSCLTFQVHLVKKEKKWQCKICNSKQSVKKIYGKGSGKDCRLHVMKLNELQYSRHSTNDCYAKDTHELEVQDCNLVTHNFTMNNIKNESKWSHYMDKADEVSDEEEEMNDKIIGNGKKKRKLNSVIYDSSDIGFELTQKNESQSSKEIETEEKKNEDEFKKHGMNFYKECSVKSGSKWAAFTDREQPVSDEECKYETETTFMNKTELCQNRNEVLLNQESLNTEKFETKRDTEIFASYNKGLVNNQWQENPILTYNKIEKTGNLKILATLHDDDDLDEILNI